MIVQAITNLNVEVKTDSNDPFYDAECKIAAKEKMDELLSSESRSDIIDKFEYIVKEDLSSHVEYKEIQVWSAGSENAKNNKFATGFGIGSTFITMIIMIVILCDILSDGLDIMGFIITVIFVLVVGCIIALNSWMIYDEYKIIKANKLIPLYLYDTKEYIKLNEIPDDKFVLFCDGYGAVLALKEYETESRHFKSGYKYFSEFEDYRTPKLEKSFKYNRRL